MDEEDTAYLIGEAKKCRQLARSLPDGEACRTLNKMATALETKAKRMQEDVGSDQ